MSERLIWKGGIGNGIQFPFWSAVGNLMTHSEQIGGGTTYTYDISIPEDESWWVIVSMFNMSADAGSTVEIFDLTNWNSLIFKETGGTYGYRRLSIESAHVLCRGKTVRLKFYNAGSGDVWIGYGFSYFRLGTVIDKLSINEEYRKQPEMREAVKENPEYVLKDYPELESIRNNLGISYEKEPCIIIEKDIPLIIREDDGHVLVTKSAYIPLNKSKNILTSISGNKKSPEYQKIISKLAERNGLSAEEVKSVISNVGGIK